MQTTRTMVYDFAIVGAGLAGASTAYGLRNRAARAGAPRPRVVILEKEPTAGEHSSGRNAALVRRHLEDPVLAPWAEQGADILTTGALARFDATGSILVGLGDEDASRRFPLAEGNGLWCPGDGVIDVAGLLATYLAGQDVRYGTEALRWSDDTRKPGREGPPLLQVHTNAGEIHTRVLVNAAGPWAGPFGRLPLTPTNRHLFVTPPMHTIDQTWPFVWDIPHGLYFRPESGGLLLCACDETAGQPGVYAEDHSVADRLAGLVQTLQPRLGALQIMRSWVGQRVFAADHRFVIGFDPRDRRLFHVAALGGHGVTTSPTVGALAADLLLNQDQPRARPFDPARLAGHPHLDPGKVLNRVLNS